jgi:hypothetical protein
MDAIISWMGNFALMRETGLVNRSIEGRRNGDPSNIWHEGDILIGIATSSAEMGQTEAFDASIRMGVTSRDG